LVSSVATRLEPAFASLTDMDWSNVSSVKDPSAFVTMILTELNTLNPIFSELIVPQRHGLFCFSLITKVVEFVSVSVHKIRGISELGSEQLLYDIKMLKGFLLKMIGSEDKWVTKIVDQKIAVLEKLCQILLCSPENLVSTYKSLFQSHTPEQLLEFLQVKGVRITEQESYLDTYGVSKSSPLRQAIRDEISDLDSTGRRIANFFDPKQYGLGV